MTNESEFRTEAKAAVILAAVKMGATMAAHGLKNAPTKDMTDVAANLFHTALRRPATKEELAAIVKGARILAAAPTVAVNAEGWAASL